MISAERIAIATFSNLANGFRSKRIWVLLLLAVLGSAVVTAGFTKVHAWLEEQVSQQAQMAKQMQGGGDEDPSEQNEDDAKKESVTADAFSGDVGREVLRASFGFEDEDQISRIVKVPLPALFYALLIFLIGPLVSVLVAGPGVASHVGSGYMRFLALRATRLELAIAHFKASSAIILALFLVGALASFVVSTMTYEGPLGSTAVHLFSSSFAGWLMALPYVGLAVGVSQLVRSGWAALGLLLVGLFGIWLLGVGLNLAETQQWLPETAIDVLGVLFPDRYENAMLDPSWLHKAPWAAGLVALSLAGFFSGFVFFRRRDL